MAFSALQAIYIVMLNALNCVLNTILPIYNKEVFKIAPYPLYMTLIQMILVIPLALIAAWATLGFPWSIRWMKPPKGAILGTTFSSLSYGTMMAAGNFGIFVSGVDFATLFRSSGIIWQALFAFLFLGEKINCVTVVSISLVLFGILTLTSKFEWSTSKMPSIAQCSIQIFSMVFSSLASVFMKKVLMNLKKTQQTYPMLVVLSWRYAIACVPIFLSSLYLEPGAWINIRNIITKKVVAYITFGAFVSELFQLSNLWLADSLSVIANTILGQLKFVPILVLSHFLYKETEWTVRQVIGAILLTCGAALYSMSKMCKMGGEPQIQTLVQQNESSEDVLDIKDAEEEEEAAET